MILKVWLDDYKSPEQNGECQKVKKTPVFAKADWKFHFTRLYIIPPSLEHHVCVLFSKNTKSKIA